MISDNKGTLITVGNAKQQFNRLLEYCVQSAHLLPKPVVVQNGNTLFNYPEFECYNFLNNDLFIKKIKSSKILIAHAGAGSIIDSICHGIKPIIMPRLKENNEHINNHQLELALKLNQIGYVYLATNLNELIDALIDAQNEKIHCLPKNNSKILNIIDELLNYK